MAWALAFPSAGTPEAAHSAVGAPPAGGAKSEGLSHRGGLTLAPRQAIYETHESIQMNKLTVIIKGLVARRICLLGNGAVLGEDCIIEDRHAWVKDLEPANCLSFVATSYIMRGEIFRVGQNFPRAMQHLKDMALKLTLKGVLTTAYRRKVNKKSNFDFTSLVA